MMTLFGGLVVEVGSVGGGWWWMWWMWPVAGG